MREESHSWETRSTYETRKGQAFWQQRASLSCQKLVALIVNLFTWPFSWSAITHLAYYLSVAPGSKWLIPLFIKLCAVDVNEDELSLRDYPNLAAYFSRNLKAQLRPICQEEHSLVAPVDGEVIAIGDLKASAKLRVKSQIYTLDKLLANSVEDGASYLNGSYMIIYMPTGVYHHVHSPCVGQIISAKFIPGRHFALHEWSREHTSELYSRNTRQINYLLPTGKEDKQALVLVQVGSALVGSIVNNFTLTEVENNMVHFTRGQDIGHFAFGSTVILIIPPGLAEFESNLRVGDSLKVGQKIGKFMEN